MAGRKLSVETIILCISKLQEKRSLSLGGGKFSPIKLTPGGRRLSPVFSYIQEARMEARHGEGA